MALPLARITCVGMGIIALVVVFIHYHANGDDDAAHDSVQTHVSALFCGAEALLSALR